MIVYLSKDQRETVCAALAKVLPENVQSLRELYRLNRPLTLTLEPSKIRKTDEQQGYYWRSVKIAADELGMSQDELHLVIKREAFGFEIVETKLGPIERIKSSEKSSREEYSKLIETLIRCCAFAGHIVEEPKRDY